MPQVTRNGRKKTKKLLNLPKKVAEKNAEKAYENGLKHSECKGNLKRYIDRLYFRHGSGCDYRVYNHHIYFFSFKGQRLITVLNLPQNLFKLADQLQKRKNCKM